MPQHIRDQRDHCYPHDESPKNLCFLRFLCVSGFSCHFCAILQKTPPPNLSTERAVCPCQQKRFANLTAKTTYPHPTKTSRHWKKRSIRPLNSSRRRAPPAPRPSAAWPGCATKSTTARETWIP